MLKLFHNDILIGLIPESDANGMDMHGLIELTADAAPYQPLFAWWTDPNRQRGQEPPFPEEQLENWFVEDEQGERQEIGLPGIYTQNNRLEILWRHF